MFDGRKVWKVNIHVEAVIGRIHTGGGSSHL